MVSAATGVSVAITASAPAPTPVSEPSPGEVVNNAKSNVETEAKPIPAPEKQPANKVNNQSTRATVSTKPYNAHPKHGNPTNNPHVNRPSGAPSHSKAAAPIQSVTHQPETQTNAPASSSASSASAPTANNQETAPAQTEIITNGHVSNQSHSNGGNGNNPNNRRVQKKNWVPLEIDIPKARGKPRERNNNVSTSSKRREIESDADYYSSEPRSNRRYRGSAPPRSSNSVSNHPSSKPIANPSRPSNVNSTSTARISGSSNVNTKRSAPIRSSGGGGGMPKSRINRISNHHHAQNGEYTVDFPVDYTLVKKIVGDNAAASPFLMPYMGTYYYNGVPSYANMDTSSLKEAIRKQV